MAERDKTVVELQATVAELQDKLQVSYHDYLLTNENIGHLQAEAAHGSEKVQKQNMSLKKNMEAVAVEYEKKRLQNEQYSEQINRLTAALKEMTEKYEKSAAVNLDVSTRLERTQRRVEHAAENFLQLENKHTELKESSTLLNGEYNKAREKLVTLTESSAKRITELESSLLATQEKERLSSENNTELQNLIGELQTEKSKLEIEAQDLIAKATTAEKLGQDAITEKNATVEKLTTETNAAKAQAKSAVEARERLNFQLTDSKHSLDRELAQTVSLQTELARLKKEHANVLDGLYDQVNKLNSAKINLSNDKQSLSEHARELRNDLLSKTKESESIYKKYEETVKAHEGRMTVEQHKFTVLDTAHKLLTENYNTTTEKLRQTESKLASSVETVKLREHQIQGYLLRILVRSSYIDELHIIKEGLEQDIIDRDQTITELRAKTAGLGQDIVQLTAKMLAERNEHLEAIAKREAAIIDLANRLAMCKVEFQRQLALRRALVEKLETTFIECKAVSEKLRQEVSTRTLLASRLRELRLEYIREKTLREDSERVEDQVQRMHVDSHLKAIGALLSREKRLDNVSLAVSKELTRLTTFTGIVPNSLIIT